MADAVPLVDVRAAYLAQQAELDAAVAGVVRSGGLILGPEVAAFEASCVAVPLADGEPCGICAAHGYPSLIRAGH